MNKSEIVENFAYNLERLRNELGYSQDKMASLLDVSSSTYRRIINLETTKIDIYTITKLYYLSHKFAFQFSEKNYKDDNLLRVAALLSECNDNELKDIEDELSEINSTFEEDCYDSSAEISFNENNKEKKVILYHPIGDLSDNMIFNTFSIDEIDISKCPAYIRKQVDCALEIPTNHFHPTYHLHDILLISQRPPKDGEIGLFIHKETFKMYIRVFKMESPRKLVPISDTGKVIEVNEKDINDMNQWIKFGVVVTKLY